MRFAIASLLVLAGLPAMAADSPQKACEKSCSARYKFCMNAATTKQMKKSCKTTRKTCKKGCVATSIKG